MRSIRVAAVLLAVAALLLAGGANAGLILYAVEVEFGDPNDEIGVYAQILGGESLGSISYDLTFGGVGVGAFNITLGPVPGPTADCPATSCQLSELGPPNPDGTGYNLHTIATGPTGGLYLIGYQTIQAGTWDGTAQFANVLAYRDEANGYEPITDIILVGQTSDVPEPGTAALLGLGLTALSIGRRRASAMRSPVPGSMASPPARFDGRASPCAR